MGKDKAFNFEGLLLERNWIIYLFNMNLLSNLPVNCECILDMSVLHGEVNMTSVLKNTS